MINSPISRIVCMILAVGYGQVVFGLTVNGDIEGGFASDTTYVGDDGVLSSTGGTAWNSIPNYVNQFGLLDEFGNPTSVGVTWTGSDFGPATDPAATNSLQDSGTWGSGFDIVGLNPNLTYELAIYAMVNAGGRVTDAVSSSWDFWTISGAPTYVMPGIVGQDYAHYLALVPLLLDGGVYGIRLSNIDGAVTGFQIRAVPLPAAVWLFGSGLLGVIGFYRRKKLA
jgi:hypothetical protein